MDAGGQERDTAHLYLMNAIEVVNVSKVYRRYARRKQFATLKSALLNGSLIRDLQPDETFPALRGVTFSVPKAVPTASSAETDRANPPSSSASPASPGPTKARLPSTAASPR